MSEAQFYTFLTGGLALAIALLTLVAWNLWRMRQEASAGRASALEGVAHELRVNLQRMISELSQHVNKLEGINKNLLGENEELRQAALDGIEISNVV